MLRSMSSAISGLKTHQTYMDVVANNIANVNTTGYKASRVNFKDALSQTYNKGTTSSSVDGENGGTNPTQVGLGVILGSVNMNMTQGSITSTGSSTDLAIQGSGFFILGNTAGQATSFTRDGSFSIDGEGYLVDSTTGLKVMGYSASTTAGAESGLVAVRIDPAWGWSEVAVGTDGNLTGTLSDGTVDTTNTNLWIGEARFSNPQGLVRSGNNMYQATASSGTAIYGTPGNSGTGTLVSGSLEGSNVDLAEQFSRMIMAERGFQANSRIITASDEMLQDLVNMKR